MKNFKINENITIGNEELVFFAGPCQIESREHCIRIADFLCEIAQKIKINLVFKSSYDKANRTSIKSKRGVGLEEGLKILKEIKEQFNVPVVTDVHTPEQVNSVAEVADVIQIPAFLCRQTDLLVAAGNSGKVVNIKKGQFLHPDDMLYSAEKVASTGNQKIILCERGTNHGYRDLVVDYRSFQTMKNLGYPVIFDASHSVQVMGSAGGKTGGNRDFIEPLSHAASSFRVNGFFVETHDDPDNAPSDGPNMLKISEIENYFTKLVKLNKFYSDL